MSFAKQLEKQIRGSILKIENAETKEAGIEIIKEANVSSKIERLKQMDEAEAEELRQRYLNVVKANSEK